MITLSDHQNVGVLNKAEVFCVIRKKLKPYLQSPESCHHILYPQNDQKLSPSKLLDLLRTPLSRDVFNYHVDSQGLKEMQLNSFKLTDSDKYAFNLLYNTVI